MAKIDELFKFSIATKTEDQLTDFIEPGFLVSYQDLAGSDRYYNGVSFSDILPENPIEEDGDGDDFFYDDILLWNSSKLNSYHSATDGEADEGRGNRLISIPMLVERVGVQPTLSLSVSHIHAGSIEYVAYNAGPNTVEINPLILSESLEDTGINDLIGLSVALSTSDGTPITLTGLGSVDYSQSETLTHYYGTVLSNNGSKLTIGLDTVPGDPGDLMNLKYVSLGKQQVYLLPLGKVISGGDEYNGKPSSLGISSWNYYEDNSKRTPQSPTISPQIRINLPSVGDKFKFVMQLERDSGYYDQSNGFFVIPTTYI